MLFKVIALAALGAASTPAVSQNDSCAAQESTCESRCGSQGMGDQLTCKADCAKTSIDCRTSTPTASPAANANGDEQGRRPKSKRKAHTKTNTTSPNTAAPAPASSTATPTTTP